MLKQARRVRGYSQVEVADKLGVAVTTISRWGTVFGSFVLCFRLLEIQP
ncbi:hypothetical protein KSX_94590 [Ktedonospora formicarum]|uniref:HTH cro/C1-type domain-containing protein n=2 Tax=Ktedonospora formicarum TaxID=2778364 RepID=A0A8J3MYU5_9CHLR|nr:hypothetical protein KSX_94590 [Ktedonospora formicarum]